MPAVADPDKPIATTWSETLRSHVLIKSGGWLYDIAVALNTVTGVWDVVILAILFVFSWVCVRTSERVTALILARVFDTTIPLQYQLSENEKVNGPHKEHLTAYWQVYWFATAGEIGCYFMLHEDLFTLITCFKTTAMLAFWLGRNADKTFWASDGIKQSDGSTVTRPSTRSTSSDPSGPSGNQHASSSSKKTLPISQEEYNELSAILDHWSASQLVRPYMIDTLVRNPKCQTRDLRKAKAQEWAALSEKQKSKMDSQVREKIKEKGWKPKKVGGEPQAR